MRALGAIIKLTFRNALRSHLFQLLLLLLLLCLVLIPTTVIGGTAGDFLKSTLFYSLWLVGAVLSLASIWLGCFVMTSDIDNYQLHMVVSKPVSRITIWFGKWIGVCLVNLILLVFSAVTIFGIILYRFDHSSFPEKEKEQVRQQVMVGRRAFYPERPNYGALGRERAKQKILRLQSQGKKVDLSTGAQDKLLKDSRQEAIVADSEVKPGFARQWVYKGIPADLQIPIYLRYRPYLNKVSSEDQRLTRVQWIVMVPKALSKAKNAPIGRKGRNYDLYPTPLSGKPEQVMSGRFHEKVLRPEWKVVTPDREVRLAVMNVEQNATHYYQPVDGPKLLIAVTSFAGNYARAVLVVALELMLLAGFGCAFGGIMSMPVAVFVVIGYLLFGSFSVYMVNQEYISGAADHIGQFIAKILLKVVIPIQSFDVSAQVSDGQLIEWSFVWQLLFSLIICRGVPLLLLGLYFYRRRELGLVIRK